MRTLVIGGARFLGPFVVDELLRRGHEVAVLGRRAGEYAAPVVHYAAEASDAAALARAVADWRPEGLVDMVHSGAAHAESVVAAAAGKVARSVHLSCASVYGLAPTCPVDEEAETLDPAAAPPEVAAKIAADRAVLAAVARADLPGIVLRLAHLYGPRDPCCAEWYFARRVLDSRRRIALPDRGLHICHRGFVQNMAWGIAQALTARRASAPVYHLGEEKLYTLAQLARGVARALDHEWELYSVPGHLWTTPYAHTSFLDLRLARAHLRYRDRMIPRDGLELTLAWLCQHPRPDDWSWPGLAHPFDYEAEDRLIAEHGARLEG